jgi:very-short-patch-repair endonuclease
MRGNPEPARRLRRNQTDAERVLWFRVRDRRLAGWKVKRQAPVDRFWNHSVLNNVDGVLDETWSTIKPYRSEPPHPTSLPCGEREQS